ncbi:hypothetical protein D030_1836A, partial [Vibrio parahaemolyticus AQ3810]
MPQGTPFFHFVITVHHYR